MVLAIGPQAYGAGTSAGTACRCSLSVLSVMRICTLAATAPDLAPAFGGSSRHPTSGNLLAKWQAAMPPIDLNDADSLEFGTLS